MSEQAVYFNGNDLTSNIVKKTSKQQLHKRFFWHKEQYLETNTSEQCWYWNTHSKIYQTTRLTWLWHSRKRLTMGKEAGWNKKKSIWRGRMYTRQINAGVAHNGWTGRIPTINNTHINIVIDYISNNYINDFHHVSIPMIMTWLWVI